MASANKFIIDGTEYVRVTDTSLGRRLQYANKVGKFTERQWLSAHREAMQAMEPARRQSISNREMKALVLSWLETPRDRRTSAKLSGIKTGIEPLAETSLKSVFAAYLAEYGNPTRNSAAAIYYTKKQCGKLLEYLEGKGITHYGNLARDDVAAYPLKPEWFKLDFGIRYFSLFYLKEK